MEGAGAVSLSAEALLRIYGAGERPAGAAWAWAVDAAHVAGRTAADCVAYTLAFTVRLSGSSDCGWAVVPLAGALAVAEAAVAAPAGGVGHVIVLPASAAASSTSTPAATATAAQLGLLARGAGVYRVTLRADGPYTGRARAQAALWLPAAARTELAFVVAGRENVLVTAEPALGGQTTSAGGGTTFTALVPPVNQLTVKWSEPAELAPPPRPPSAAAAPSADGMKSAANGAAAPAAVALPLSVTVDQEHLFSLGEGVLMISSQFTYALRNGGLAVVELALDPRLRVLTVDGDSLLRWDAVPASAASPPVLRVVLDRNVEDNYQLAMTSEIDLGATSCTFVCPVFAHLGAFISRERGAIGVSARTNVEVDQVQTPSGCAPADVSELSSTIRSATASPLLLGASCRAHCPTGVATVRLMIPLLFRSLQVSAAGVRPAAFSQAPWRCGRVHCPFVSPMVTGKLERLQRSVFAHA
jgi:hypothetical protein